MSTRATAHVFGRALYFPLGKVEIHVYREMIDSRYHIEIETRRTRMLNIALWRYR